MTRYALRNPSHNLHQEEVKEQKKKKKSQMKATKNFKLLSFGDEAEGDEDETQQV